MRRVAGFVRAAEILVHCRDLIQLLMERSWTYNMEEEPIGEIDIIEALVSKKTTSCPSTPGPLAGSSLDGRPEESNGRIARYGTSKEHVKPVRTASCPEAGFRY